MATDLNALREETTTLEQNTVRTRVSVVICCYTMSRLEMTTQCALAVLANTKAPDQLLIVVDNNPELRERLRERLPNEVELIDNHGHGLSDGRNTGLREARSEVVAFIDDDAWPDAKWLERLLRNFEDPDLIGVGGLVTPEWEDPGRALPEELYWVVGSTYRGHRTDAGPITRPIGANMAARREVLLQFGGFSADFGRRNNAGSNEELAMFSAVAEHFGPGRVWFVPDAVVHHFAPAGRCRFSYLIRRSLIEGRSKADARNRYGPQTMAHDRDYVRNVIVPAVVSHAVAAMRYGDSARLRSAVQIASCFLLTACAYAGRRARTATREVTARRQDLNRQEP